MRKNTLGVFGLAVAAALVISPAAFAQGNTDNTIKGNGLRISPVRTNLTVEPGQSAQIRISIENVTDKPAELSGVVNDFVPGGDESGQPRLLMDDSEKAPRNGLKQYVADLGDINLKPKERKDVTAVIKIPADAAGGGYYGAVRFLPKGTGGDNNVSLAASVASLMLVTVPGDVKQQIEIAGFNVAKKDGKASTFFTDGNNLQNTVRFTNKGNTHTDPFGKVLLKKNGKIVGTFEVNNTTPRGNILPDSTRRFTVEFGDKAAGVGKYTVEGNFGYGGDGKIASARTTFYVVPWAYIIAAIVLIALIAAVIFKFVRNRPKSHAKRK